MLAKQKGKRNTWRLPRHAWITDGEVKGSGLLGEGVRAEKEERVERGVKTAP